jgi:hypothetical protein
MIEHYDPETKTWREETKEEVMSQVDIENKSPCEKCWKIAKKYGVYVWPLLPEGLKKAKRCKQCGRVIG